MPVFPLTLSFSTLDSQQRLQTSARQTQMSSFLTCFTAKNYFYSQVSSKEYCLYCKVGGGYVILRKAERSNPYCEEWIKRLHKTYVNSVCIAPLWLALHDVHLNSLQVYHLGYCTRKTRYTVMRASQAL